MLSAELPWEQIYLNTCSQATKLSSSIQKKTKKTRDDTRGSEAKGRAASLSEPWPSLLRLRLWQSIHLTDGPNRHKESDLCSENGLEMGIQLGRGLAGSQLEETLGQGQETGWGGREQQLTDTAAGRLELRERDCLGGRHAHNRCTPRELWSK